MKGYTMKTILLFLLMLPTFLPAQVQVQFGLGFDDRGLNGVSVRLSEAYRIPEREAYELCGLPEEDIPIVLILHARSPHSVRQIVALRRNGATWAQLSAWCGVPLSACDLGRPVVPPYGHAYGYYQHGRGRHGYVADREIMPGSGRAYPWRSSERRHDGDRSGRGGRGRWKDDD